ncbi:hypothetical protein CAPTEDRAFT_206602 [Capitella teleta]|uniref:Sulfotransferase domain-containing protein n=1 Tax=Capitella teleta TaxID=283909 RepID=R7T9J7_CAPTE|nr:hypothetical protein CAPTEDRAFT_206602 [Capitella teleta]|eukprot:ELT88080.1 hypothetical protein CAPTEDRAFT_206602 [Capitella teleta]
MKAKRCLVVIIFGLIIVLLFYHLFTEPSSDNQNGLSPKKAKGKDLSDKSLDEYLRSFPRNATGLKLYKNFQKAPFTPGSPKTVVVVTYQRSGSSFFGKIFDQNPNAFYVYEPLDALYTSIYGTAEGWNTPSDITSFWNGSERIPPSDDVDKVAHFLHSLLHCKTDDLPTEFFRHKYWAKMTGAFQTQQKPYSACLSKLDRSVFRCGDILPESQCPARLGEDWHKLWLCKQSLIQSYGSAYLRYQLCNYETRQSLEPCIEILSQNCTSAEMRVTKTVRATMPSIRTLLEIDTNVRIVNLVRDPRAVALSRMSFFSTRGSFSKNNRILEAKIFCRSVTRDLNLFNELRQQHPGKLIQVIYDDFVKDPQEYAKAIYEFLDSPPPQETLRWLSINTKGKRNSTNIADQWQSRIPYGEVRLINEFCKEYLDLIPYPWA